MADNHNRTTNNPKRRFVLVFGAFPSGLLALIVSADVYVRYLDDVEFNLYYKDRNTQHIPIGNRSGSFQNKENPFSNNIILVTVRFLENDSKYDTVLICDSIVCVVGSYPQEDRLNSQLGAVTKSEVCLTSGGGRSMRNELILYKHDNSYIFRKSSTIIFVLNFDEFEEFSSGIIGDSDSGDTRSCLQP